MTFLDRRGASSQFICIKAECYCVACKGYTLNYFVALSSHCIPIGTRVTTLCSRHRFSTTLSGAVLHISASLAENLLCKQVAVFLPLKQDS